MVLQFGNPRGVLGRLAGFIMSHRSSNLERISWAVELLGVQPRDCVLEIGFGPGIGIRMLGELATDGMVYGVDHSALMLEQASRKNRERVKQSRVKLMVASASRLPRFDRLLDKVLDINSFQFWDDQLAALTSIRQQLRPGSVIAIAHQPRNKGAIENDTIKAGERIAGRLAACGFQEPRVELRQMKPVSAVCVIAKNPR